jgi:tellurite resistance protein
MEEEREAGDHGGGGEKGAERGEQSILHVAPMVAHRAEQAVFAEIRKALGVRPARNHRWP